MKTKIQRVVSVAAIVGIGGWMVILGGFLWWKLEPVDLPVLKTPIPILNEDNEIPIGDPIVMELNVSKPLGVRVDQSLRFIRCDSGNLITLTSAERDLPVGSFKVIADTVTLPAKVAPGDTCVFVYRNTYNVNPIRSETIEWASEPFTVLPGPSS